MERKEFQAESKRLLDLMIHSIYTHKEIFLREILSNASDAIDKLCYRSLTDEQVGMKREDFAITIRPDQEARTLTVSDNGIGMSPEFAQKIFEPFERERTSTVSRIQGTGLGMAITRNIVEMMGGTIKVQTEKNRGTEFIICLPMRTQAEHRRQHQRRSAAHKPLQLFHEPFLLIM